MHKIEVFEQSTLNEALDETVLAINMTGKNPTMANFDQSLAAQLDDFESINRHVNYLNSLDAERRTANIYRNRSVLLETMWRICRDRHSLLVQIANPDQKENDYFKNGQFGSFELQFFEELDKFTEIILELQPPSQPLASSTHHPGFNDSIRQQPASASAVKLPRINLPSFSGLFSEWQSFKDSFSSLVIDDKNINNLAKLHFLKSSLTGEALDLICNIQVTSDNFQIAWNLLTSRYDNKRAIVTAHLNAIFSLEPLKKESASGLLQIFNTIQKHLAALRNLGRPTDDYSDILINRVINLLDFRTQRDWELSLAQTTECPKYSDLEKFLLERIRVLESIPLSNTTSTPKSNSQNNQKADNKSKLTNVNSHMTSAQDEVCSFCKGNHVLYKCPKFLEKSISEKYDFAKLHKICTNCLRFQHKTSECKSKFTCLKCKRHHHTILHRESPAEVNVENKTKSESSQQNSGFQVVESFTSQTHYSNSNRLNANSVLLATARVWVVSNKGRAIRARALLDPGSTCSFISKDLSKLLNSRCIPVSASLSGLGGASAGKATSAMEIGISPELNSKLILKTNALIIPKVTDYIPESQLNLENCLHLRGLPLADDPSNDDPIHLLIGAELYSFLILDGIKKGSPDQPVAINSIFGWVLSGKLPDTEMNNDSNIQVHLCLSNENTNASLQRFWEIEEIPSKKIMSLDDELCEEHFRKTHSRVSDGRYKVELPFNTEKPIDIGSTRHIAEKSLTCLESRLQKKPEQKLSYNDFMKDYEVKNHMRIAPPVKPNEQVVYSPHHPVIRVSSQTTKVRAVFNSSKPSSNGTSLNDHLRIGPKLQKDLCMILLNWRTFRFVYIADIAQMYRQILVHESDLNYQRILWRYSPEDPISEYQLLTVTYGTRPAPFLALRVLKQLIEDEGFAFPLASFILENNIFIDDCLFGGPSKKIARQMRDEVIALLGNAKFEPRKWASNDPDLISDIDPSDHGLAWTSPSTDCEGIKVLGLGWNPDNDQFYFDVKSIETENLTKRSVLSVLAQFYDPVGWISPVIIKGKIFMQQLWRLQCSWDDRLPEKIANQWVEYVQSLTNLNLIRIPRWIQLSPDNLDVQLHGFSDASEVAYGAVLYVRVTLSTNEVITHMLISKTKVAPIKTLSLPRLELQAAVLLAKLIDSVQEAKCLSFNSVHCWTDATIVLAWLNKHASEWKTFIGNRVSEIHSLLPNCSWRHVPTASNPADIASRGSSPTDLSSNELWWKGPKWLSLAPCDWPAQISKVELETEVEAKIHAHIITDLPTDRMNDLAINYSSWNKLLRATAILCRFIIWIKNHRKNQSLKVISAIELEKAQTIWIRYLQKVQFTSEIKALKKSMPLPSKSKLKSLNPFIDDKELLRIGGRLENSDLSFESKHPLILESHHVVKLMVTEIHENCFHGGLQLVLSIVRQSVWLIHPRPLIKSIIHNCLICIRYRAQRATQLMSDLPKYRITKPERAFINCGIDYAGPMQVRMAGGRGRHSQPCYIAVFVCFAVKAVHLEVVTNYTSSAFIAAFQRFSSIRGLPRRLFSDCGTNFKGADRELRTAFQNAIDSFEFQNLIAKDHVEWVFNPPAAPHFGGLWESAVKSMKTRLVKIFGNRTPTYEELVTAVYQISAILNSRPLMPVTDHIDDLEILTPGHSLIGGPFTSLPQPSLVNLNVNRLNRWQQKQQMYEIFWDRWSSDYLQTLQRRVKWQEIQDSALLGQMVILRQANLPPAKWLLGRIIEVCKKPGKLTRVVKVKTSNSEYLRPITELVLLPFGAFDSDNDNKNCDQDVQNDISEKH